MIKNVIFDLGGVLFDWDPRYIYRDLLQTEAEVNHFLENICTNDWNKEQDAGRPLAEGTRILTEQYPEHAELISHYYGDWPKSLKGEITGTINILNQLKRRNFNLYALTNWSAETFVYAKDNYAFLNDFIDIVVSGTEKCVKPDAKVYQILLDRNHIIANESLFIDDRQENVDTALALGMQGVTFKSPEKLREQLETLALI
ncbi:HAD family hydrolase [Piscirickettsia litoralis]|uniref:HAD family hydrolase n=1 Tax=Piscirickettsia litoralis TaxID=1891921 RepID=A0ABX3A3U1_9GAMM|nr:HAD family phosphatase [Piscirickettsia litoralis]ODN42321.1 HAD family hydrolase [Piscirickettsia litoralis]